MVRPISVLGTPSARPLKPFGVIVCLRILDLQLCPGVRASASETQAVVPGTVVPSPTPGRDVSMLQAGPGSAGGMFGYEGRRGRLAVDTGGGADGRAAGRWRTLAAHLLLRFPLARP